MPAENPDVGSVLAGYRIDGLLGRGGMGVVYRAFDLALERSVALKVLAPELAGDDAFRERFHRESRLAASMDHPSIVPIYDAGEADGQLYIAMRLVDGTDLKTLIGREGALGPERTLKILGQVADALDAAHQRGLIHRDVKPSNILIDTRGHCYLADFGLSRQLAQQDVGGSVYARSLGTIDYASPEQIRGEPASAQTDVYSLGCVLYECLSGEPPFRRPTDLGVVFAHLEDTPPTLPRLERVIDRALAKNPDARYSTCREFANDARTALGFGGRQWSRRRILVGGLATVATAAAAIMTPVLILSGGGDAAARADAVAGQALGIVNADPVAGLRLAVEAATATHTAETESALRVALSANPLRRTLCCQPMGFTGAAFSADGKLIVTGGNDGTARIWGASTGRVLHVLRDHGHRAVSAVFSPDGKRIVTADADGTATIWDTASGRALQVLHTHNNAGFGLSAVFSSDGKEVLTLGSSAETWDPASGHMLHVLVPGAVSGLPYSTPAFSPDGKQIVAVSHADNGDAARIWDASSGRTLRILRHSLWVLSAVFSPDGRRVVTASRDGTARVWDAASGRTLLVLRIHTSFVNNAVFSADGKRIVTAGGDGIVRVWDAATGRILRVLRTGTDDSFGAVFSPDGNLVMALAGRRDPLRSVRLL